MLDHPRLVGWAVRADDLDIDWGDAIHPSTSVPTGLTLVSFHLEHPRPEVLTGVLDALAVQAAVVRGPAPRLVARIDGPGGSADLR